MITDARKIEFEQAIRRDVPRELLVDVVEQFPLAAEQADAAVRGAQKAVKNGVALSRLRESKAVGLVRHHLIDEVFEQIVGRHGGEEVKSVVVEAGPDELKASPVHLTISRFGDTLLGFASHREQDDAPVRNATRKALCHQNRGLGPDLFHGPEMFRDRQRFVAIMVRRDPEALGKIASLKVSILDSRCEHYLYQEDLADFLAGYGGAAASSPKTTPKLKEVAGGFKASRSGSRSGSPDVKAESE